MHFSLTLQLFLFLSLPTAQQQQIGQAVQPNNKAVIDHPSLPAHVRQARQKPCAYAPDLRSIPEHKKFKSNHR